MSEKPTAEEIADSILDRQNERSLLQRHGYIFLRNDIAQALREMEQQGYERGLKEARNGISFNLAKEEKAMNNAHERFSQFLLSISRQPKLKKTHLQNLGEKYWKESPFGCWEWQRGFRDGGYGAAWDARSGKLVNAHRLTYELFNGPIKSGLELDHLCRKPNCVNPDHLEAVTHRENVLRGNGACARNARKTHCPKGHTYTNYPNQNRRDCKKCHRARENRPGK